MPGDRFSLLRFPMPVFAFPEQCNTCGYCAMMCPHWAVEVFLSANLPGSPPVREMVAGPPRLAPSPPLANCPGCQHPTVGRIIAELLDELGVADRVLAIDAVGCATSSAFGMDFGRKLNIYERPLDVATLLKRDNPQALVFSVQGDGDCLALTAESLIGALIRADKLTVIMCNRANYGVGTGQLPPATYISTPTGQELMVGGYPVHAAELAATFKGVAYSARGSLTSPNEYQRTKMYIRAALQKQLENIGLSFVEVLTACCPEWRLAPVDYLKWVKEEMTAEFPLGEFKNVNGIA